MQHSLFDKPTQLQLPDAEMLFYAKVDLGCDPDKLLQQLITTGAWQHEDITVFGKTHPQPRLVAWYGDEGASYTYSGTEHQPLPWTHELLHLKNIVETLSASKFNSVLLNFYRNERDSMGLHADDEPELGREPIIASLSLGEERTIYFRHRHRRDIKTFNLPLGHASLLVMRGATQGNWSLCRTPSSTRCN